MIASTAVGQLLSSLLGLFLYILLARIIIEYIMMFARSWQPRGLVLMLVDLVFQITDPPMKLVRRFVPPLRLGQVSLDLAFLVLFFGVQILMGFVSLL
ncbi:MAG: YggT family protein [Candidatus Nanopelagicales bacterium]